MGNYNLKKMLLLFIEYILKIGTKTSFFKISLQFQLFTFLPRFIIIDYFLEVRKFFTEIRSIKIEEVLLILLKKCLFMFISVKN